MELRHLKYVVAVARNGSFAAASHELNVQPPVISRRIRELEDEIETQLFERSTAGVRTTPIGEDFVSFAEGILADVQRLLDRTCASRVGKLGRITLGFYNNISAGAPRSLIRQFREHHPDIHVELLEMPLVELTGQLHAGKLDAAVILGDTAKCASLEFRALWSERLVVVLPKSHRLSENPFVYWSELKGERFLISRHDPGPDILNLLIANLAAPADRPDVSSMSLSYASILAQVADGEGISLQCESNGGISKFDLALRPVYNAAGATRLGYTLCWNRGNRNPALKTFLDDLPRQM
ncbi:LysR family transcriptional regulator [Hyphomicrobium sp.]|uniref:LysR family transcriptional regulator n=1 Tax=Hyphomicrobium sp. TaxID=82 RepID=UPI002FE13C79